MTQTSTLLGSDAPKFWLGQIFETANASTELVSEDVLVAIRRHQSGDWGDLCIADKEANEKAVVDGGRIFSAYHDRNGTKFWIITEADRRTTTVLLPGDY